MKQLISILTIILFFNFSCKREQDYCIDNPEISYINISKASLELTQYFTNPKFDTISFSSSKGDTLVFVRNKTDSTWYDDKKYSGVPGCGPLEIHKNMEITNYYLTIKGDGIFRVKHSTLTKAAYNNNDIDNVIEFIFLNNHFYFVEYVFNDLFYGRFIGNYKVGSQIYANVFYEYSDFNYNKQIVGILAPGIGLIEVKDSLNMVTYTLSN